MFTMYVLLAFDLSVLRLFRVLIIRTCIVQVHTYIHTAADLAKPEAMDGMSLGEKLSTVQGKKGNKIDTYI